MKSISDKEKIILVGGARPNFMKIAPVYHKLRHNKLFTPILVHTGQHYDNNMSQVFFKDFNLPKPEIFLGVGSASHAIQTARIMSRFEKTCTSVRPDLVIVFGDVNSTLACSITAVKLCIPVAHVEAGLRSFDRTMPEEINRIITDSISDILFTTCEDANKNLLKEGIDKNKIYFVGNVMIDTLLKFKKKIEYKKDKVCRVPYALLTLHRPSNVDKKIVLADIMEAVNEISKEIAVLFSIHPRTKKQLEKYGFLKYFRKYLSNRLQVEGTGVYSMPPLPYVEFLSLMANAKFVLTDSGGIQEETTILGIPCLTLRENTERPITIREGTNLLVGVKKQKIIDESRKIIRGEVKKPGIPKFWDGESANRIIEIIRKNIK